MKSELTYTVKIVVDADTLNVQIWNQGGRKQKRIDEIAKRYASENETTEKAEVAK